MRPDVVICLGATPGMALLGRSFRGTKQRGQLLPFEQAVGSDDLEERPGWIMGTLHPTAILRTPSDKRDRGVRRTRRGPAGGRAGARRRVTSDPGEQLRSPKRPDSRGSRARQVPRYTRLASRPLIDRRIVYEFGVLFGGRAVERLTSTI